MNRLAIICLPFLVWNMAGQAAPVQQRYPIADTRHDLSFGGPGPVLPAEEELLCIFCHTPYGLDPQSPRWGGEVDSDRSELAEAPPDRPDGASLLCLSCHDGIIALGDVLNTTLPASFRDEEPEDLMRTHLADGHPVSFIYDEELVRVNGKLAHPDTLPEAVRLDRNGKLQCTSCHDPHHDSFDNFLVMNNRSAALCTTCHITAGWEGSSHRQSTAGWNHSGADPWLFTSLGTTVADHGCENCHIPHTAGSGKGLLNFAVEEENCSACHNGNVAARDVMADFNKFSRHPIGETEGEHDPAEAILMGSTNRHVECSDCHNPHASRGTADDHLPGALANLSGIDFNGGEIFTITEEYQLCFRCHADSGEQPAPPTPRLHDQNNVRLLFNPGNPSFHPVTGPGTNPNVPSLIAPLTEIDTMTCGDCHASNSAAKAGGQGANGPHGSIYPSILVRQYLTQDGTLESPAAYALCYGCHDRDSIRANESFRQHDLHISGDNTPCNVCHDPHGISYIQGSRIENSHLINFDVSVVFPNTSGQLRFEDRGSFRGACFLRCHGREHNGLSY